MQEIPHRTETFKERKMSDASLKQNEVALASVVMDKNPVLNRMKLLCDFNH